ncbi:uncharacterized protein ACA1_244780 [Acanthamoeba castellanii str. Neff]|uniref:Uncharacterized protein n=1 Tax=Acanthamoeba castellanii (strain ATCC 30010 / Neff) TaxID=1257118 RepID=L8GL28_ACACF|nr:uncharacterized protein ACA1_244780 [Acanthamoeba castellanii str. Neff]ELR13428.1 hypothetical protein ACA1_244780 [Acanthamoeba castellanii str. Neff]
MEAPPNELGRKKIKKIIFDDDEEDDDDIMDETVEVVTAYDSEGSDHAMAMSNGDVHTTRAGNGTNLGVLRSSESVLDDSSSDSDGDLSSESESDDRSDSESSKEGSDDYQGTGAAQPQKAPPPPSREDEDFQEPLDEESRSLSTVVAPCSFYHGQARNFLEQFD